MAAYYPDISVTDEKNELTFINRLLKKAKFFKQMHRHIVICEEIIARTDKLIAIDSLYFDWEICGRSLLAKTRALLLLDKKDDAEAIANDPKYATIHEISLIKALCLDARGIDGEVVELLSMKASLTREEMFVFAKASGKIGKFDLAFQIYLQLISSPPAKYIVPVDTTALFSFTVFLAMCYLNNIELKKVFVWQNITYNTNEIDKFIVASLAIFPDQYQSSFDKLHNSLFKQFYGKNLITNPSDFLDKINLELKKVIADIFAYANEAKSAKHLNVLAECFEPSVLMPADEIAASSQTVITTHLSDPATKIQSPRDSDCGYASSDADTVPQRPEDPAFDSPAARHVDGAIAAPTPTTLGKSNKPDQSKEPKQSDKKIPTAPKAKKPKDPKPQEVQPEKVIAADTQRSLDFALQSEAHVAPTQPRRNCCWSWFCRRKEPVRKSKLSAARLDEIKARFTPK